MSKDPGTDAAGALTARLRAEIALACEAAASRVEAAMRAGEFARARVALDDAEALAGVRRRFDAAFVSGAVLSSPATPAPEPGPVPSPPPPEPTPDFTPPPVAEPPAPGTAEPAPVTEPPPVALAQPVAEPVKAKVPKEKPAPRRREIVSPPPPPGPDLVGARDRLLMAVRSGIRTPTTDVERLEFNSLALLTRALIARKDDGSAHAQDDLREFIAAAEGPFYGFATHRYWPFETWFDLSEAYRALAVATRLTGGPTKLTGVEESELAGSAAAAIALIQATLRAAVPDAGDRTVALLGERLADAGKSIVLKNARAAAEDPARRDDVARSAARAFDIEREVLRNADRAKRKERAESDLATLLREGHDDFEGELVRRVQDLLDSGVPTSDKGLRALLAGYGTWLEGAGANKKMDELRRYLAAPVPGPARAAVEAEPSTPEEPSEVDAKMAEVRELLSGKTLALVGGSKGQHSRRGEIVAALGLADLLWPDVEDDTKVATIYPKVKGADVVCLLVRWCRHAYKDVIDEAKGDGKRTAMITAGLNPRTIAMNLHAQLIAPKSAT